MLANYVAVERLKKNDYFYFFLVLDDLVEQIEKLLLVLCIFYKTVGCKA
jgi:hypothetical protein